MLKKHLKQIRQRNSAFSLRSFARRLKISPGALSEILNGQRKVSATLGSKLLGHLDIEGEELAAFQSALSEGETKRVLVPLAAAELVSNWKYFAILSAFELDDPISTPEDAAQVLGIPLADAQTYFDYLETHAFIAKDSAGQFHSRSQNWTTEDGIASQALREVHRSGFRLANEALEAIPVKERDFYSMTFAGSADQLAAAREEIRKCVDRIEKIMSRGKVETVYKCSVQLFPLDGRTAE